MEANSSLTLKMEMVLLSDPRQRTDPGVRFLLAPKELELVYDRKPTNEAQSSKVVILSRDYQFPQVAFELLIISCSGRKLFSVRWCFDLQTLITTNDLYSLKIVLV